MVVGDNVSRKPPDGLSSWLEGRTVFVVTSPDVWALHGEALDTVLASAARVLRFEVAEGEVAKNLAHAERLWDQMLDSGGKRDSRVVALGGGSVSDLAGFAAGCFLRGVDLAVVPTTLLAQVDASIGGKTAINLPAAKNSVGLFHHPQWVLADTRFLSTLASEEVRSGLVEVVKAGVALDAHLFAVVEEDLDRLLAADPEALPPVIAEAIAAKIAVVEKDPDEKGPRRLLNLGHTLGHALEARLGYRGLRHGEAIGHGLLFALRLAQRRSLSQDAANRISRLIERFGLPKLPTLEPAELLRSMRLDKKNREESTAWVLPVEVGKAEIFTDFSESEVGEELHRFFAEPPV